MSIHRASVSPAVHHRMGKTSLKAVRANPSVLFCTCVRLYAIGNLFFHLYDPTHTHIRTRSHPTFSVESINWPTNCVRVLLHCTSTSQTNILWAKNLVFRRGKSGTGEGEKNRKRVMDCFYSIRSSRIIGGRGQRGERVRSRVKSKSNRFNQKK